MPQGFLSWRPAGPAKRPCPTFRPSPHPTENWFSHSACRPTALPPTASTAKAPLWCFPAPSDTNSAENAAVATLPTGKRRISKETWISTAASCSRAPSSRPLTKPGNQSGAKKAASAITIMKWPSRWAVRPAKASSCWFSVSAFTTKAWPSATNSRSRGERSPIS